MIVKTLLDIIFLQLLHLKIMIELQDLEINSLHYAIQRNMNLVKYK